MSGFGRKLQRATSGATLSISPVSGSAQNGNNITLSIYEDSGATAVNAVQANLSYSTSSLQYVTSTNSGSPFATPIQNSGGSGSVQIAVASLGTSSTGKQLVATVTFTILAVGASNVAFSNSSAIDRSSDSSNILTIKSGATVTGT